MEAEEVEIVWRNKQERGGRKPELILWVENMEEGKRIYRNILSIFKSSYKHHRKDELAGLWE